MKQFFLFLVLFFSFQYSQAQFSLFGEVGGVSSSLVLIDDPTSLDLSSLSSTYFSLVPKIKISDKSSINAEVSLVHKGHLLNNSLSGIRLTYLSIAPQYEYELFRYMSLFSGLEIGYLTKEEIKVPKEGWKNSKELFGPQDEKIDISIPIGLRLHLNRIQLSMSYNVGVKDINPYNLRDEEGKSVDVSAYHRYYKVGLGYRFL